MIKQWKCVHITQSTILKTQFALKLSGLYLEKTIYDYADALHPSGKLIKVLDNCIVLTSDDDILLAIFEFDKEIEEEPIDVGKLISDSLNKVDETYEHDKTRFCKYCARQYDEDNSKCDICDEMSDYRSFIPKTCFNCKWGNAEASSIGQVLCSYEDEESPRITGVEEMCTEGWEPDIPKDDLNEKA